jgi:High potential iron-sulfur protein
VVVVSIRSSFLKGKAMNQQNRRVFLMQVVTGAAVVASGPVLAQATKAPMVDEADATAASLGYKADATKVDVKKYAKYAAPQACSNCQLYQGDAKAAAGNCSIFAGKQVAAKGWCSAYIKKAA